MSMDELRRLHVRHGAAGVDLDHAKHPDIPEGWGIIVRCWERGGLLRRGSWDALIRPPRPIVGWRLAEPFERSRTAAIKRAIREIDAHLATVATPKVATSCATCRCDIGLWSPPNLAAGYTHIRSDGGARFDLNSDHEIVPADYVPFPPDWAVKG
jgi:hypothetical protein